MVDTRRTADDALRTADADATRWQARAETLAAALDASRDAAALDALDDVPGVIGPLVDHLDIDAGVEAAVHAVLGDAVRAVVVDGPVAARQAFERLATGDSGALLVVAEAAGSSGAPAPAPSVPGARLLAGCVRSTVPGLAAAVERLLDGAVLADGDWSRALDLVLRDRRSPWSP